MAKTLEFGIFYFFAEFLAHAFRVFRSFEHAGTISAGAFKTFLDKFYGFRIWVESYFHFSPRNQMVMCINFEPSKNPNERELPPLGRDIEPGLNTESPHSNVFSSGIWVWP